MDRCPTRPLTRQLKPSQLVVAQRQIPVASFDIGTRTLANLRARSGLLSQVALGLWTQLTQGSTRLKQRCAKAAGELPKRLAITDGASLGHSFEVKRWNELSVHGV